MQYKQIYQSPLGDLTLLSDEGALQGLWFNDQRYFGGSFDLDQANDAGTEILNETKDWLDRYFDGKQPSITELMLAPQVTEFRHRVLDILTHVPYGQTITYQQIATKLEEQNRAKKGSARAVGGAVGHNPISIIIPCHRVIGTNGDLTGYAGGIERKIQLLRLEGVAY